MSYESVDKIQNLLAGTVFAYTNDRKKAAGRALGTFIEIISYYLMKAWGLDTFTAIERPLGEYANADITHNVEFTLHGRVRATEIPLEETVSLPFTCTKLQKMIPAEYLAEQIIKKSGNQLLDRHSTLRNACNIANGNNSFLNAYYDTIHPAVVVSELVNHPFAMVECKRVGVEEGQTKGPQTIEKAKQGSYVARTVSSLQRVRLNDGSLGGVIEENGEFRVGDYYSLLDEIISSDNSALLQNFILTIGMVSNHGNWFTSDNPNKELRVLAQSYDWLLFLTDSGISRFITDLLLNDQNPELAPVKAAFEQSYRADKKQNVFTKVRMNAHADAVLQRYFHENLDEIESWMNIISPGNRGLDALKQELFLLRDKNWEAIYTLSTSKTGDTSC